MTDITDFPSLAGTQRAQAEDLAWAAGIFGWAIFRLRAADTVACPSDRLCRARLNSADAIRELLEDWSPAEPPN
jgi:hypothetical protein